MGKKLLTVPALPLLAAAALLVTASAGKGAEACGKAGPETHCAGEAVSCYLENSVLEPAPGREVFSAYHVFGSRGNRLFIWAYISEYQAENGKPEKKRARSGPMIIFLSPGGAVKGHWEPEPGRKYPESIRKKFPEQYQEDVLDFHTRHKNILRKLEYSAGKKAKSHERSAEGFDRILRPGETASIRLDANRTTGYKWFYTIRDRGIIDVVSDEYREDEHEERVLGAGGVRIIKIKGLRKGSTRIRLEYRRGWNPDDIDRTRLIRIRVRGDEKACPGAPPGRLDAEYISFSDWNVEVFSSRNEYPRCFGVKEGRVFCRNKEMPENQQEEILEKTIDGRKYCIRKSSQGAAGTIYRKYTYAAVKKGKLVTVSFTAGFTCCGNYEEPARSECEAERRSFSPDQAVDRAVERLVME